MLSVSLNKTIPSFLPLEDWCGDREVDADRVIRDSYKNGQAEADKEKKKKEKTASLMMYLTYF